VTGDLDQARLDAEGDAAGLSVRGRYLTSTGSTNSDLRAVAAGAPHGAFLVTDVQTAGRGRLGRVWEAPAGANLAISVLIRAPLPPDRRPLVCLAAAVALAELLPGCAIKWPNDVLNRAGQKVAGILAEVESDALIVGIGVNVRAAPPLPGAGVVDGGDAIDRSALAVAIVRALLAHTEALAHDPAHVLDRWRARAHTLGRAVRVGDIEGLAFDIEASGALLVATASGVRRVLAGDVEMIARS
jgi:BirA family biotin operon repressor/biotin-[acetyl-CoA-carboxylase] ligase